LFFILDPESKYMQALLLDPSREFAVQIESVSPWCLV
jgi:hypothetical protein